MLNKTKQPTVSSCDEYYEEKRFDYHKCITGLSKAFTDLCAADKLCNLLPDSEHWKDIKSSKYVKFKFTYNTACSFYDDLIKYHKEHYDDFIKCKTWNETLKHPDDWLLDWVVKET